MSEPRTTDALPTTAAEAAQLIADAYNTARQAGFDVWNDDRHIRCDRDNDGTLDCAGIYEDHERVWRLI